MKRELLEILADPYSQEPVELAAVTEENPPGNVQEGCLRSHSGRQFAVSAGIPRFVPLSEDDQGRTASSFAFKWKRRDSWDSSRVRAVARDWLLKRYGFESIVRMRDFFASCGTVLDAGCGGGMSSSLWMEGDWNDGAEWVGLDVSSAIDVAQERLGTLPGTHFVQGDVMSPPFRHGIFGAIFSEGVLHHTPSTEAALRALVPLLQPEGEILFYVYRRKAPVREFADDYIRDTVSKLDPAQAWEALRPLTRLGQALADLKVEVEVPEDVPYLGIRAGRHDMQRLVYWSFLKLYWNAEYSFEENLHVNFDWYHPRYAHRQTEEEVRDWCEGSGLSIVRFDVEDSGFTVRARRS